MLTPTEAQAYLAEQLPDKIYIGQGAVVGSKIYFWFNNEVVYKGREDEEVLCPIHESSWLSIAHEVEGKMSWGQWYNYLDALINLCPSGQRAVVSATYAQRATAMKESGMKI